MPKKARRFYKLKRLYLSLLEVLIALLLVIMALPILTSSFIFTSVEQQKIINHMALNSIANHAFAVIYEDLATNAITYSTLESSRVFPFEKKHLGDASNRWQGSFTFQKNEPEKPKRTQYHVELWQVLMELKQSGQKEPSKFVYDFIVIRDLVRLVEQENEKESD